MNTILNATDARIFYDGLLTEPRLDHPESLAIHRDGSIWCGGEQGQIYRIDPDGASMKEIAFSGGFSQGMAFDKEDDLYVCDIKHQAVFKFDARSGHYEKFAEGADGRRIQIPNYPAFGPDGTLYVSDSNAFKTPGPGIFRFNPDGTGNLWYREPVDFANGLALSPDSSYLYVAETFANAIFRIPINYDGSAGPRQEVAALPGILPDGLAFDADGNLYVGCYEPSQVLRVTPGGAVERLIGDDEAHLFCHPTNLAFRDSTLFTSNLGRWHITAIDTAAKGLALFGGYRQASSA
jgi:sugar lactone lactonase YvrE